MDAVQFVKDYGPWATFAVGLFTLVKFWREAKADVRKAADTRRAAAEEQDANRNELIKIAQTEARAIIGELRTQADRLQEELDEMKAEFARFRKVHDTMIADKDAQLRALWIKNSQLEAALETYEKLLTAHGIPHERPPIATAILEYHEVRDGTERPVTLTRD